MPPVGFEITISAGEGPQTYAVDGAATGTGKINTQGGIMYFINIGSLRIGLLNRKKLDK
jgi:hypothetical protein